MWANPMTQQPCRCRRRSFDVMTMCEIRASRAICTHTQCKHTFPTCSVWCFLPWLGIEMSSSGKEQQTSGSSRPTQLANGNRLWKSQSTCIPMHSTLHGKNTDHRNADSTAEVSGWFQNNHLTWSQLKSFQKKQGKTGNLAKTQVATLVQQE